MLVILNCIPIVMYHHHVTYILQLTSYITGVTLAVDKCFVCRLSTKKYVTHKNYSVNNVPLSQVDKVPDLDIIVGSCKDRS